MAAQAFVHFKKRGRLSTLLLILGWAGCAVAASHGIYGIINRLLQIAGAAALEGGPFNMIEHAYVFWDLILFEPWFLVEGLLFAGVGWCYLSRSQTRQLWLVLCVLGISAGLVSGLLRVRFA